MKRIIFLSVIASFFLGTVAAQELTTDVILLNHKTLEKKAEKSDEAINHEKKSQKANTWTARGRLFQDIDNQGLEQLQLGIDKTTIKVFYKDPLSVEKTENGEILKYETINYYMENNRLRGWTRNNPIVEKPLDEALQSYEKAIELTDPEKRMKLEEKLLNDLNELKDQFMREGQNQYYLENYKAALHNFEQKLALNEMEIFGGLIDTLMINYSGIVAREIGREAMEAGNTEEGEKYYKKTLAYYDKLSDLGYGGATNYIQMTRDYYTIGDTLAAIENLKKGLEVYPDSTLLVTIAAQAYYLMKDNEGGLEFVKERLEKKPNCPAAYYWKGLLITNYPDVEEDVIKEALALYDTSLMYDPTNSNVMYQSGYVNYAVGLNYFEQESYEEDDALRAELNKKGTEYYKKAVEKLEKTYEIAGDDATLVKESLDLLKRIYYKLYGSEDERYISVNDRLNAL